MIESLLNSDVVLFILGLIAAQWFKRGDQGDAARIMLENTNTRLSATEKWIETHHTIHACVQKLAATVEGLAQRSADFQARTEGLTAELLSAKRQIAEWLEEMHAIAHPSPVGRRKVASKTMS